MIRIDKLNKYYNKGRQNELHVLRNVGLELPESGMVAVFGRSGCGKTTLLNVIGGLDSFADGSVTVDGKNIAKDGDLIRNELMGYVFQNYNLQRSETCFENVADALKLCGMTDEAETEVRVMAALRNVGMDKYRSRTPDTLSGGQQQRIAIARAIVKNPRIILADEPTGNLDEENTVMIMNLLRQIADDHLVILVTHEANLVDHYCDTVIELRDGEISDVRHNSEVGGYTARGKNDIYLGELERKEISSSGVELEYYGEPPKAPVRLRIVNSGGKLYVKIDTDKVQVLDELSEVKLKEGVYEEQRAQGENRENIDMSALPPIKGERFGRLFSFGSSLKSGYRANFKKSKRGKNILRRCMCLFAAALVFVCAVFGTSFGTLEDISDAYNHNVFYVYTPNADVSDRLLKAMEDGEGGIDFLTLTSGVPNGDTKVKFVTGFFETFTTLYQSDSFETNAVFLDSTLVKDSRLVAGKRDGLAENDVLISTAVADKLLDSSVVGYIDGYEDLIGLIARFSSISGKNMKIAGVVESDEPAVYLGELAMAKYALQYLNSRVEPAEDYSLETEAGTAILLCNADIGGTADDYPELGSTVKLRGKEFKLGRIIKLTGDYGQWLKDNGIKKQSEQQFLEALAASEPSTDVFDERYYDYKEYYYSELDRYVDEYYGIFKQDNIGFWLSREKDGMEAYKYLNVDSEYLAALLYKADNGTYPKRSDVAELSSYVERIDSVSFGYDEEYNSTYRDNSFSNTYAVRESDYIELSKRVGETTALPNVTSSYQGAYGEEYVYSEQGETYIISSSVYNDGVDMTAAYTVLHSSDPELTERYLANNFSDTKTENSYDRAILSPNDVRDEMLSENRREIITGAVTVAVILAVMSVCMFFIMRSSLMNRIKEVGIYRAIGVSKKNLIFKFFAESIVLTVLTVVIGYLVTSAAVLLCLGIAPTVSSMLYYPLWYAGAVFAVLCALCLFCGTLPIISLLRKTPSEILAKYDI